MGAGFSESGSQSQSTNQAASTPVQGAATQSAVNLLNNNGGLNMQEYGQLGNAMQQYTDPNYLNVAQNPYIQNDIAALTQGANTNMAQNLAGLKSQFAAQGQTGAGADSPLAQTEAETIGQGQASLNELIAQQLMGAQQQANQTQLAGLGQYGQYLGMPANIASMLGGLTGSGQSTGSASGMGVSVQGPSK